MNNPFSNRRSSTLLNRVRDDISHLRDDVGDLLTHTARKALPDGARDLADQAKSGLAAGGAYAMSRYRNMRGRSAYEQAGWLGGAVVLGLLAIGVFALCRECSRANEADYDDYDDYDSDDLT